MNLRSGTVVGAHVLNPQHRPAFEGESQPPLHATAGSDLLFSTLEGIRQIFSRWTALCLAVEQQWGGGSSAEKARSLHEEILDWFYSRKGETRQR